MAAGKYARWTKPLAAAIGISPQALRVRLKNNGYRPPFTNEARALKILDELGVSYKGYKPQANSSAVIDADPASWKVKGETTTQLPTKVPPSAALPSPVAPAATPLTGWDRQLIRRLAALLPEGNTFEGKKRARQILKKHGYRGPRWDNETRGVAIFKAEGIDVSKFQYLKPPPAPAAQTPPPAQSIPVSPQPQATALPDEKLLDDYHKTRERLREAMTAIKLASGMLRQYEVQMTAKIHSGMNGGVWEKPLAFPVEALNEFRERKLI